MKVIIIKTRLKLKSHFTEYCFAGSVVLTISIFSGVVIENSVS